MHAQAELKVKYAIYVQMFSEAAITVDKLYFTSEPVLGVRIILFINCVEK